MIIEDKVVSVRLGHIVPSCNRSISYLVFVLDIDEVNNHGAVEELACFPQFKSAPMNVLSAHSFKIILNALAFVGNRGIEIHVSCSLIYLFFFLLKAHIFEDHILNISVL